MKEIEDQLLKFERITFLEKTHSYLIDGAPTGAPSVTQLLKRHKKPFDLEAVSARVAKRKGVTTESIKAEWSSANLYSTKIGSMLHKYIENFYLNIKAPFEGTFEELSYEQKKKIERNLPLLVSHFKEFYQENPHIKCVRTEVVLGDIHDTKVCGMADVLAFNEESQKLEILDFKTNKKMEKKTKYGNLLYPFDTMSEGQINEYTIQLNTYKYFIEKETNLRIDKLKIVWFNPENKSYKLFELEDIQDKIKEMFLLFKKSSLFEEK